MGKNIDKKMSKNLSGKYSQTLFDHAKKAATDALKTSSKTEEAAGNLIGNKSGHRITKSSKDSETVTTKHDKETRKKRHVSPEARLEIIDDLRLK